MVSAPLTHYIGSKGNSKKVAAKVKARRSKEKQKRDPKYAKY